MAWTLQPMTQAMADFVAAYLEVKTVKGACRIVGKSPPHGFRNMRDPRVIEAIRLGAVPPEAIVEAYQIQKPAIMAGQRRRTAGVEQEIAEVQEIGASYADPIAPAMAALPDQLAETLTYDKPRVLQRLSMIAEANAIDFFKSERRSGKIRMVMKRLDELPRGLAYAINKLKISRTGAIEVTLEPKLRALALIGQATGAFGAGGEADDSASKPAGGEITDPALTLESRLQHYDNVISPRFPRAAEPT